MSMVLGCCRVIVRVRITHLPSHQNASRLALLLPWFPLTLGSDRRVTHLAKASLVDFLTPHFRTANRHHTIASQRARWTRF